jgi:hypothetical protein
VYWWFWHCWVLWKPVAKPLAEAAKSPTANSKRAGGFLALSKIASHNYLIINVLKFYPKPKWFWTFDKSRLTATAVF